VPQKAGLEQQILALEKSKANRLEPLRNFILEANTAEKWVSDEDWLKIKEFRHADNTTLSCCVIEFRDLAGKFVYQ